MKLQYKTVALRLSGSERLLSSVQHAYPVDVVCGVVQHYRGTRTVPFLRTRLNYSNTYYEYYQY